MLPRYLVFAGDGYYPCGGWEDIVSTYATLEEAIVAAFTFLVDGGMYKWAHVVDLTLQNEQAIVWSKRT